MSPAMAPSDRLVVMLVISSLEHGGAERQVIELARRLDRRRFDPLIVSLTDKNPLLDAVDTAGIELHVIPKRSRFDFSVVGRLSRLMRDRGVHIAHAFLFDAEMATRVAARLARTPVVIASERNTEYERPLVHRAGLWLTRSWFDVMIANSLSGKRFNMRTQHLPAERIHVIHNGVDTQYFRPQDAGPLRESLGIPPTDPVAGMVAVFKRQKRHADFLRAAAQTLRRVPNAWFVLVGEPLRDNQQGAGDYYREVRVLADQLNFGDRLKWLGRRNDMPAVYNLCDLVVLTSSREGTPNALLEAMACGTPVIATNVADNAHLVPQRVGMLFEVGDVRRLTDHMVDVLSSREWAAELGAAARAWVSEEFSTQRLIDRTQDVYSSVYRAKRGATMADPRHDFQNGELRTAQGGGGS